MAEFYKILKADPLGDPWESHGKQNQSYWCQVEGQDKAVSISKQVGNTLLPGQHVYGDLMYAKSQKGTEYWKFKGAQVPEGVQRPTDTPSSPAQATAQAATGSVNMSATMPDWFHPIANMVEYIYKEMKKMDDSTTPEEMAKLEKTEPENTGQSEHKGVEQIAGEPLDEETQATLDSIFGEPPVEEQ